MIGVRDAVLGSVLALAVVASPWIYEHLAYRSAVQRLAAAAQAREERVEALRKERDRGPRQVELARRLAALHVGDSLASTLRQLGEVAAGVRLTPSAMLVLPPVRADVARGEDGPTSWLEEFPVQVTVPGSLEGLLRYLEALARAPLPLRVDWVRLDDRDRDPTRGVVLRLGLRVLVPASQG